MIDFYDSNLVLVQSTLIGLLLALSIQVPLRMGVFSFGGVGCYGIGAYLTGILIIRYDFSPILSILLSAIAAAVVSFGLGLLINKLSGLYLGMATVAFDLIISVVAVNGGDLTGGPTGLFGAITDITMTVVFTIVVVVVVLVAVTERGRLGRRIDAVRDDPELAASVGISVRRYRLVGFVVSGALGGAAGAMNILVRSTVTPQDIGFGLIVLALTMIIVGGARSWKGAVLGAVIFTWLPEILTFVGDWQPLIYGIIVALAAIFLPRGIHGLWVDSRRALQRRRREKAAGGAAGVPGDDDDDSGSTVIETLKESSEVEATS
jgi:branched-chain amino acid transport system permease protein